MAVVLLPSPRAGEADDFAFFLVACAEHQVGAQQLVSLLAGEVQLVGKDLLLLCQGFRLALARLLSDDVFSFLPVHHFFTSVRPKD